jgi:hypothetical protein
MCRKKSLPHPGVIHLVAPDSFVNQGKEREAKTVSSDDVLYVLVLLSTERAFIPLAIAK